MNCAGNSILSWLGHIPAMVREYNAGECAVINPITIAVRYNRHC